MTWKVDRELAVGYGSHPVATVSEDLLFQGGAITLLLGLNGQGKTTFMKTLAGLVQPLAGRLTPTRGLYLSDDVDFPGRLTPREIVQCLDPGPNINPWGTKCWLAWRWKTRICSSFKRQSPESADHLRRNHFRNRKVCFLSLDEPFAGLDFEPSLVTA